MRGADSQDQRLRNEYRVDGIPVRIGLVRAEKTRRGEKRRRRWGYGAGH
jgi:hypothetical protein